MLATQPRAPPILLGSQPITSTIQTQSIHFFARRTGADRGPKKWRRTLAFPGEKEEMPVRTAEGRADSIGVAGATIRVYSTSACFRILLTLHNRLIGLTPQKPFESLCAGHSVFWRATEERWGILQHSSSPETISSRRPPGGQAYITGDSVVMTRGKEVFGGVVRLVIRANSRAKYRSAFREGKAWFRTAVMASDFLENNFLSNEQALSIDQDRDELRSRVWTNAKAVTSGTIFPR